MNWKLILQLSLFGLAMAFASVYWLPMNIEWVIWLIIFFICAAVIAKSAPGNYFMHGFMVSIFNCIWITAVQVWLFKYYMANHPGMLDDYKKMPGILGEHPRRGMLITGPIVGVLSGLILGLFSVIASKIVKRTPVSS